MKRISAAVFALLLLASLALPVFAEYPGSPDWDYPLPTDAVLITGTIFGTNPWNGNESSMPQAAFDGDNLTFFDAAAGGAAAMEGEWVMDGPGFVGIQASEPYILTEIRVLPREGFTDRTVGAGIQGSNDGKSWVQIYIFNENIGGQDYITVKSADFITNEPFTYFRYCQTTAAHCDVADVEFYGNPAGAAAAPQETAAPAEETAEAPAETEAPAAVEAPKTADGMTVAAAAAVCALAAAFVIIKKKK